MADVDPDDGPFVISIFNDIIGLSNENCFDRIDNTRSFVTIMFVNTSCPEVAVLHFNDVIDIHSEYSHADPKFDIVPAILIFGLIFDTPKLDPEI